MTDVLVVDDDVILGAFLGLALERRGYAVTHADDGQRAQEAFQAKPADVVLTDIVMPEVEGLELILWLRRANSRTKIIAMTGNPNARDGNYLDIAKRFGADQVLEKPFAASDLLAVLRDLLGTQTNAAVSARDDGFRRT